MAPNGNSNTQQRVTSGVKERLIILVNAALLAAIFILPARSLSAANKAVEWGYLTRIGGSGNIVTLGYAGGLGVGVLNLATIVGTMVVLTSLIGLVAAIRSRRGN